jgi:hypothetical protein
MLQPDGRLGLRRRPSFSGMSTAISTGVTFYFCTGHLAPFSTRDCGLDLYFGAKPPITAPRIEYLFPRRSFVCKLGVHCILLNDI